MSNGSEKVNKNWNVVTWFLALFTLLVSVLILILTVEICYTELLKSLWEFIKDKRIIVISTLLASVSLLSFLLQVYIDPRKVSEVKPWIPVVAWFLTSLTLLVSVSKECDKDYSASYWDLLSLAGTGGFFDRRAKELIKKELMP